jgi:L-glyceraldehyde 3-phosphate reductase
MTPIEESMGALDHAVRQGKALNVGISSYSDERTREAVAILRGLGTPLLIHQPSYSMFNQWIEERLLDVLEEEGVECIAFSPLAQGLLTSRYLTGVPEGSRASQGTLLAKSMLNEDNMMRVRMLAQIARERGQTLSQLALAWALRDERVTSVVIGVSSVEQLDENLNSLANRSFSDEELDRIDETGNSSDL